MATAQAERYTGGSVDAAVPISDLVRDPRISRLTDDRIAYEVRERWQASVNATHDLRTRQWPRNVFATFSDYDHMWSGKFHRWLATPLRQAKRYRTSLLPGRLAYFAARMTQSAPEWTCIPAGDSIADEETSKFCEKVLRYAYREQRVDLARYFAVIQMCLFGLGILEACVDDEATVECEYEVETGEDGMPIFDMQAETPTPVYKVGRDGKPKIKECWNRPGIRTRPVSPAAFAVPPGMEWPLLLDAPYCTKASMLSESYVRRRFDVPASESLVSDGHPSQYEAMTSFMWSQSNPYAGSTDLNQGRVLVLQYYEPARDAKGYEKGKILTVVGDKLIGDDPSLFEDGHYPFFIYPWLPIPGSFQPFPWMNPQIDPQRRVDQTLTHLMDHLSRVGSPNIIHDRNDGYPPKTPFSYQVIGTQPGLRRPEFMQAPVMPTGAYEMHGTAKKDIDDTSMSYPLARGESQGGVTSGLHARLIQDADQTEMGPIVRLHAAEFSRMGESILELYREYGGDDRMLAIVGDGSKSEMFSFKRSRIPLGQRVFVQEDSLLVHYRSALEERATQIAGAGGFGNLLTEPLAREKFRKAIRDPHLAGPLTPEEIQKQFIDEVHYRILHEGQKVPVESWWDLQAHRAGAHDRLCRESLRWDDDLKARFMDYWTQIEDAIQKVEQEAQQAALEQAQQGIELQKKDYENEASAKAKVEFQRGVNKLAVESMKGDKSIGAGAGVAAPSGGGEEEEGGGEDAAPAKGAA